jgi:ParB/RepB/Spo0J family partition protein
MASLKQRLANAASDGEEQTEALLKEGGERFANVPLEFIEPDPDQPRKNIGNIEELKASISEHGIIQPIVVSPYGKEIFRIIAGERRFTAAKALGLKTVPTIIRTVEEHRRLEVQLIENIHRQELSPLEEATAYQRLMEEFQLSQRQLSKRLGKSLTGINETLRILSLPEDILEGVRTSEHLSRSVLLAIAKQEPGDAQRALWEQALGGALTVKVARQHKSSSQDDAPPKTRTSIPFKTRSATVTVIFPQDHVTPTQVVEALTQALKEARSTLKLASLDSTSAPESATDDSK